MFCTKCGSQLPEDARFCTVCGASVGIEAESLESSMTDEAFEPKTAATQPRGLTTQMPAVGATAPQGQQPRKRTGLVVGAVITSCAAVAAVVAAVVLFLGSPAFKPVSIDSATFPDERMRSIVSLTFDTDGDGVVSEGEMASVRTLELDGVQDLTGLETIGQLDEVTITRHPSNRVEIPQNSKAQSVVVKESPQVEEIAIPSGPDVKTIDVAGTNVKAIDLSGTPNLVSLDVTGTKIATLDVSPCRKLEDLKAENTPITSLDVSSNKELEQLLIPQGVVLAGIEATKLHEYWLPTSFTYEYERKGTETLTSNITYNDEGLVTRLTYERFKGSDYSYEYDETGHVVSMVDDGAYPSRTTISYDGEGRVASWSRTSSVQGNASMSYAYEDGGLTLRCKGTSSNGIQEDYEVEYDRDGHATATSFSSVSAQGSSEMRDATMEYDATGQLVSCRQSDRSDPNTVYAITWNADQRIAKITKTLNGGVTEGNEFVFDADGRLERVTGISDFAGSASSFTYNAQGLPTSWVVDTNAGSTPVKVTYKRYLTADEDYVPQQVVLFGDLYPRINAEFWDPASICNPMTDCIMRLPAMVPSLTSAR